ncbi:MAG: hypothetical protein ACPG4T_12460, partial [Nannocystaceae bacterium]
DESKAIRTLDVMLSEPQVLVPLENFGEVLYAIIKEETVVTVLPRGHGEEILQRGQALEQRVKAGEVRMQEREEPERYDHRRRWRRESSAPIVERIMRPSTSTTGSHTISSDNFETVVDRPVTRHVVAPPAPPSAGVPAQPPAQPPVQTTLVQPPVQEPVQTLQPSVAPIAATPPAIPPRIRQAPTPAQPIAPITRKPKTPVEQAIARGLELGRRRAAVAALRETLNTADPEAAFEPIWQILSQKGIAPAITLGDLSKALSKT